MMRCSRVHECEGKLKKEEKQNLSSGCRQTETASISSNRECDSGQKSTMVAIFVYLLGARIPDESSFTTSCALCIQYLVKEVLLFRQSLVFTLHTYIYEVK